MEDWEEAGVVGSLFVYSCHGWMHESLILADWMTVIPYDIAHCLVSKTPHIGTHTPVGFPYCYLDMCTSGRGREQRRLLGRATILPVPAAPLRSLTCLPSRRAWPFFLFFFLLDVPGHVAQAATLAHETIISGVFRQGKKEASRWWRHRHSLALVTQDMHAENGDGVIPKCTVLGGLVL